MKQPHESYSPPLLSEAELQQVSRFLQVQTGMVFGESKRYYIERRMALGMARAGAPTVAAYLARLPFDVAEAQALVNAFTINETYFFREDGQFSALVEHILPRIVSGRTPGALVRLWSMPCSTGEEPYSLAIWLLENWSMVDAWHVEIVGSDLDTAALDRARQGRYGERSLQRLSPEIQNRYFGPIKNYDREIIADLKESVHFSSANLIDPISMRAHGKFDVIFCRNLLIYFDKVARQRAADHLYESLNPGGYLCLGHTESMARISDRFELVRFGDAIVYRRP